MASQKVLDAFSRQTFIIFLFGYILNETFNKALQIGFEMCYIDPYVNYQQRSVRRLQMVAFNKHLATEPAHERDEELCVDQHNLIDKSKSFKFFIFFFRSTCAEFATQSIVYASNTSSSNDSHTLLTPAYPKI